jgi:hypothetical protein
MSSRKLPLTLLLHRPRLDDIYQTLDLLHCVPRMQANPHSLPTLWYSRWYNSSHHEAFPLTVSSELFRCRRKK